MANTGGFYRSPTERQAQTKEPGCSKLVEQCETGAAMDRVSGSFPGKVKYPSRQTGPALCDYFALDVPRKYATNGVRTVALFSIDRRAVAGASPVLGEGDGLANVKWTFHPSYCMEVRRCLCRLWTRARFFRVQWIA